MTKEEKAKEIYTPDWEFVTGSFDSTFKMLACKKDKYKEVTINLTPQPEKLDDGKIRHGLNYSIAKIDLHNGTFASASKVFDDATLLAEQIAKRWNAYNDLSSQLAAYKEMLQELVEHHNRLKYINFNGMDKHVEYGMQLYHKAKTLIE